MYHVGIDLGGTNIAVGVVDEAYRIVGRAKCKTNLPRPAREIVDDMIKTAREAVKNAGLSMEDIETVGVGCPGTCNGDTGEVEYSNNLQFDHVPLVKWLEEGLGRPVRMDNDANVAALGEAVAGAAKGVQSCVCITLGTGVGGGVIIDGKIFSGANFAGAELGHTVIVVDGEPCTCGRNGCWEAYASATALIRQTERAIAANPDCQMATMLEDGRVTGRTAFDAMRAGCPVGKQVVDTYIHYIACGLLDMINIFQPEVLCIGGGICNEGETLLVPLRSEIEQFRYSKHSKRQTRLCVAALGNDAGIIGAAAL